MLTHNLNQDQYNFSAEPKVVKPRAKYREAPQQEEEASLANANIMYDKRVIRGNTYSLMGTASRENVQPLKNATNRPRPKHLSPGKMYDTSEMEAIHADVSTPRPVEGRRHADTQTEETIEYLTDRPPEFEKDAQTDFYIDRPVNRLFVPQKIGEDRETQIWEGELFDFDYEVEPILQVLIGKTLEQGRMEVLEEEEHKQMKEEQKRYDELRYAELTEAQKMEAEERRKLDETERRRKQHRLKNDQGTTSHKKFVSRIMAKNALQNVLANGMAALREQGNFQVAFDFELHHTLMPWIYSDLVELQEEGYTITDTINALNAIIQQNVARAHEQAIQREIDRKIQVQIDLENKEKEKLERRRKRAEARAQRDEEERLRVLKEKIEANLIAKGEQKQNIFNQVLSDIDCLGRNGSSVGLIGGVIGELLVVLSTLEDLKNIEETDPLTNLRTIEITQETVQKVVKWLVEELVKEGKIEIGINADVEAELQAIDPELTIENLHTKPAHAEAIRDTLAAYMNSYVLSAILQNLEDLNICGPHIQLIVQAFIDFILSAEESARKVRLVKTPMDYSEDPRLEVLSVFMPPFPENPPLFNLAEAKGVKQKKTKKVEGEATQTIEATATEDIGPVAITSAEIDFEDLVTICPSETPEVRTLLLHRNAAIILRRSLLIYISSLFKELDMKEIEVLKRVNNKAEGVEKAVLGEFPKKINVFAFDRY